LQVAAFNISAQDSKPAHFNYNNTLYPFYPETLIKLPGIPSPLLLENGTEIITVITSNNNYQFIPVTVENGSALNYKERQWYAKGLQRVVDTSDFPFLAAAGLHLEDELNSTKSITGKDVDDINGIGRPGNYSGTGFIAEDEDIISVLKGDNRLVSRLGLTHPDLAGTLFHVFNIIITVKKDSQRGGTNGFMYNGKRVDVRFWGHKGWQESIFNDEILGYWEIEISREPEKHEMDFLSAHYPDLTEDQMALLINKLSLIHTGEMVPFYIMRYGFYEGHSDYRADPLALAFIFGLKTIEEIEKSFEGNLYDTLTKHFID
jgi:hypothetical protein